MEKDPAPPEKEHLLDKILSIFGQPDYAISEEKRNGFILNCARVGAGIGLVSSLLRRGNTFKEMIRDNKTYVFLQWAKGTLLGGVSGGLYVASVGQIAKYRGNKDGPINHLLASYAFVFPYTASYRKTYRFFFLSGLIWGLVFMTVKSAGQREFFNTIFLKNPEAIRIPRYPEVYLYQQTRRDLDSGKI